MSLLLLLLHEYASRASDSNPSVLRFRSIHSSFLFLFLLGSFIPSIHGLFITSVHHVHFIQFHSIPYRHLFTPLHSILVYSKTTAHTRILLPPKYTAARTCSTVPDCKKNIHPNSRDNKRHGRTECSTRADGCRDESDLGTACDCNRFLHRHCNWEIWTCHSGPVRDGPRAGRRNCRTGQRQCQKSQRLGGNGGCVDVVVVVVVVVVAEQPSWGRSRRAAPKRREESS